MIIVQSCGHVAHFRCPGIVHIVAQGCNGAVDRSAVTALHRLEQPRDVISNRVMRIQRRVQTGPCRRRRVGDRWRVSLIVPGGAVGQAREKLAEVMIMSQQPIQLIEMSRRWVAGSSWVGDRSCARNRRRTGVVGIASAPRVVLGMATSARRVMGIAGRRCAAGSGRVGDRR